MRSETHNGTATSIAAAESMRGSKLRIRGQVYGFILDQRHMGATADEIEDNLEIAGNTVRPRIVELREMSLIRNSGNLRKTRSGRSAVVWVVA